METSVAFPHLQLVISGWHP